MITSCFDPALPLSPSTPTASDIRTNSLILTWLAPEFNGGIPLRDYELQIKNITGNVFQWLMFTTQLSVEVKNLLAGVRYSFRVAARNELGRGRWSAETPFILMRVEGLFNVALFFHEFLSKLPTFGWSLPLYVFELFLNFPLIVVKICR